MIVLAKRTWVLSLLSLVSVAAVAGAAEYAAAVETLDVNGTADAVEFTIQSSEAVRYTYFELDGPRVVVDFHDSENRLGYQTTAVGQGGVETVRVASFNDDSRNVTRVVFDLANRTPYQVIDDGAGRVRVRFGPAGAGSMAELPAGEATPPPATAAEPEPSSEAFLSRVAEAAPTPLPIAESPATGSVIADADSTAEAAPSEAAAASPEDAAVLRIASAAPEALVSSEPVREPAVPAAAFAEIETGPAPVRTAPAPTVTVASPLASAAAPPPAPPSPFLQEEEAPEPEPQYTGEIVSFNLVGSDIRDFFRVIAELSGLNIILDEGVTGQLTLVLDNVPWDQALDVVLRTNNLGYELQGNILRIAPQSVLQAEEAARRALREAQELNVPLETRPFILSYTTAAAVSGVISDLLTARGTILQDLRRNALIITDVPSQFGQIESLIAFLDTPSQQVEIEARLLSATKSFSRELGSQLGFVINNNGQNVLGGVPGSPSPFSRTPPPALTVGGGGQMPLVADFPSAASSGFSFLLGAGGDILLDEIITVAESNGTAKLLSRPRVVTQNNVAATVSQGTQIPVQTNVNNTISVEFLPFNLSLTVTPQITDAGTILLTADIVNSSPDFGRAVGGIPSVSSQQATTTVLIPDGGTAVVGGILIDNDSVNVNQIPGLGSIPLIGNLFKSTSTVKTTSELLFFITARIKPSDPLEFLSGNIENESELFGGTVEEPTLQ